ncbi:unnamed protein product [Ceutorhynchus assimilis]|uniref:Uncharacterized protein n=1 Tax=Ceutorhynchus assimilis TaxID=467358 RepID=A0A9N9MLJ9_9CUCU|nr:unnamed protein product [Ceutorhynchus assimilis]
MDPKEEEKLLRWYNEVESEESNLKSSQNYNIDEEDEEIESEAEESSRQTTRDLNRQSIHDDNKLGESSGETSKNRGHPNRRQYQDLESDEEEPFPASDSEYEPSSESETESEQESEIDDNDEDVDGDVNQPTIIAWNEVDGTSLKQFTFIDSGQINVPPNLRPVDLFRLIVDSDIRLRGVEYIRGNLILCCADCYEQANSSDPASDPACLAQALREIKAELVDKSVFIARLKNEKLMLLEAAESMECELTSENRLLKAKLKELEKKTDNISLLFRCTVATQTHSIISASTKNNARQTSDTSSMSEVESSLAELQSTLAEHKRTEYTLKADYEASREELRKSVDALSEIKNLNAQMITMIETLSQDNLFLSNELEGLKQLFSRRFTHSTVQDCCPVPRSTSGCRRCCAEDDGHSLFHELSAVFYFRSKYVTYWDRRFF